MSDVRLGKSLKSQSQYLLYGDNITNNITVIGQKLSINQSDNPMIL